MQVQQAVFRIDGKDNLIGIRKQGREQLTVCSIARKSYIKMQPLCPQMDVSLQQIVLLNAEIHGRRRGKGRSFCGKPVKAGGFGGAQALQIDVLRVGRVQ